MEGALSAVLSILFILAVGAVYGMYEWNRFERHQEACERDVTLWKAELNGACRAPDLHKIPGRLESCDATRASYEAESDHEQCSLARWWASMWLMHVVGRLNYYVANERTGLSLAFACGVGLIVLLLWLVRTLLWRLLFGPGGGGLAGGAYMQPQPYMYPPPPGFSYQNGLPPSPQQQPQQPIVYYVMDGGATAARSYPPQGYSAPNLPRREGGRQRRIGGPIRQSSQQGLQVYKPRPPPSISEEFEDAEGY